MGHFCGDYEEYETLEVVHKNSKGVAGLFRKEVFGEYAEELKNEVKLVWFELH